MNTQKPTVNAVYDIPDERDYKYESVFGVQKEYPKKYIMDQGEYQNQGLEDFTKYMCVFYSTGHGNNEQNIIEGSKIRIDNKNFGTLAAENNLLDLEAGALLKNGPDFARTLKYIAAHTKVQSISEIKDSIVNNRPIVIGTNKGDWSKAMIAPFILLLGSSYGHAFVIIGYDDDYEGGCLICKNSYGEDWGDNGKFYIKYSDYKEILFYSKYSLTDEIDPITTYKQKIMAGINIEKAKEAFEAGIWNGENPTGTVSREECVTMVMRALEKLQK